MFSCESAVWTKAVLTPRISFPTDFIKKTVRFSSPSPARSLFHAVGRYVWRQWDRPCDQLVRPSWLLRACQYADGYHHRRDAQQAVWRQKITVISGKGGRYIHGDSVWLQYHLFFVSTLFKILSLLHTLHVWFSHRTFSTDRSKWWGLNLLV